MIKLNFKTISVGFLIFLAIYFLMIFVQTIIGFYISFERPFAAYFLGRYFPIIISGIYIGYSKESNKIFHGALIGSMFPVAIFLLDIIFRSSISVTDLNIYSLIIRMVRYGFICSISSWLCFKVFKKYGLNKTVNLNLS